jgi:hypothetical protein
VTLRSGETYDGVFYMHGVRILQGEPGMRMKFRTEFVSEDLFMRSDYEYGGGIIMPIAVELSVLDHPLVN